MFFESIIKDKQELMLLRKKLLKYCSPKVLSRITPNNLHELAPYISPYPLDKLIAQIKEDNSLLYYLTLADIDYLPLEKEKNALLEELIGIAKGNFSPEEAGVAKVKLQAIQMILSKIETKNTASTDLSAKELQTLLPSSVKKMSVDEIEARIERLNETA